MYPSRSTITREWDEGDAEISCSENRGCGSKHRCDEDVVRGGENGYCLPKEEEEGPEEGCINIPAQEGFEDLVQGGEKGYCLAKEEEGSEEGCINIPAQEGSEEGGIHILPAQGYSQSTLPEKD